MTDLYALLRERIAGTAGTLLGAEILPVQIDCPAQGCPARCALPRILGEDAAAWAQALQQDIAAFTLFGQPLLSKVEHNEGHLLFHLTDAFYTAALKIVLDELPGVTDPGPSTPQEDAARARIAYTMRRMWMLSRKARGEPKCPSNPAVQRALFLAIGVLERLNHPRALTLRLLAASDALLSMTRSVLPRQRPALCTQAAHVGDAAARIYQLGLSQKR